MNRCIAVAAVLLAATPVLAATDLSKPGALERLKANRPDHYDAALQVANVGARLTCGQQDLEMLKERHAVSRLDCGFVNSITDPPQRRLRFTLGEEEYVLNVKLQDTAPRFMNR